MFDFLRKKTNEEPIKIPQKTFDNEFLARAVIQKGNNVKMNYLCQCHMTYKECELNCVNFFYCPYRRDAEAMMKDYKQKEIESKKKEEA